MTTIAYRDGVLAADTGITGDGIRCGHYAKIVRKGRLLLGFAGKAANFEAFRTWVASGMPDRFHSVGGNVFIIPPTGPAVVWGDGEYPWRENEDQWALGSGEQIALGAMAAGASAEGAVRAAREIDTGTSGEIMVLHR